MQKLTYHGTPVSPNQIISKHGYLVCMNVPICRTGTQWYSGSELEGHPGYDPSWGIESNTRYPVLRTFDEVTNPATVASFEGNSVVDEHPPSDKYPGSLVTCENDSELNRGHGQNVRVGGEESLRDGETPLLADLHVKDIGLIRKVDSGIKEVSCGYTFTLARRDDGQLLMTNIRGNHIAIVPNGRAGSEVAIQDAALPIPQQKEKKTVKNLKQHLIGLGLIAAASATDADPEKIAEMAKEATKDELEPDAEKSAKDKAAKDAEEAKKKEEEAAKDASDHPEGCRCDAKACKDSMKSMKDKAAKDAKSGKDAPDLEDLEDEPSKASVIADTEKDLELEETADDLGEGVLKGKGVLDSARELIKVMKPIIGGGDAPKAAVDSYNKLVKSINALKDVKNPYAALIHVQPPVLALDSAPKDRINPRTFFEGVTYEEGNKKYREYLASKGAK